MYLKKIISSGFKSFADKVTITLEKNHITGIVGPNGSGKSNVIDSVRWVMGEQNAKMLRGEKATDIIFAGSEKRKPLGLAEVTLVFDNGEASAVCPPEFRSEPEIALTRRLYMDGQREYFINKKPCRLKDIVNFFTSTGLGGRSYSMIQQGQVDRILQAKPEQLREIIEEAAGTLVFKKRKNEAEKKLQNTRLNLSRIDDILTELERQKKALSDQVEKAKKWRERSESLTSQETMLLVHNHRFFTEKLDQINKEIQLIREQEVTSHTEISGFEARLEELHGELADADPEVQALGEEITVLREKIAATEASLMSAISLLDGGDKRIIEIRGELGEELTHKKEFEEKYNLSKSALEQAELHAEQSRTLIETFDERVDELNERARVYETKIGELTEEVHTVTRLIDQNALRSEDASRKIEEQRTVAETIKTKVVNFENDLNQSMIVVEGANVKASNRKRELTDLQTRKDEANTRMSARAAEVSSLISERDSTKQEYMTITAKLEALREMEADADASKAAVNKFIDLSDNTACLLTDSLSLNEKSGELSKAALSAFETWADRIFLKEADRFEEIANICKQENATGFSVTLNTPHNTNEIRNWCSENGAIAMSNYLNITDSGLEDVVKRIAYVHSDHPQSISEFPAGLILFTKSGLTISGGDDIYLANENSKGALTRRKEIEKLDLRVVKLHKSVEKIEEKIEKIKEQQLKDQTEVKSLDVDIQEKNSEVMRAMTEYETARSSAGLKREQITSLREEMARSDAQIDHLQKTIEHLFEDSEKLESQKIKAAEEKEQLIMDNESTIEENAELKRQYESARIDFASANTKAEGLREGFDEQQTRLHTLTERVVKKEETLSRLEEDISEASQRKETLEKDIESFIYRREELEESLTSKREANAGLLEEMKVLENRAKDQRNELQKAQKKVSQKEIELERASIALAGTTEQAGEKYQIDLAESDLEIPEDFEADKVSKAVSRIRTKIESMGPINMMAIEEYDNLDERETFISKQREEVQSSVDLLELAIEEIEEHSEDKFLSAFHTLNKEFAELFPILFPGGDAAIVLTNEQNPLDGGVEIMVRLPGKKRQNMRLFSGGEKALTAIALIFGLLKSKPTPFCFLDEVDAPLDETNVGRYNKVLEKLSKQFQFIVITHNRRTMEVLNTLYGITMQEPGVSKVVGVDLEKTLPSHLKKAFKDAKPGASTQ
jgi:chromosome segregation protein